ncbi:MAG: acylphosphatase [Methylacidiphilales bacterium]|nr:acylphosphatase [Candidatus Methylacidiphilales bacterium]MDW8349949.1 acylphosphatase [Verrucomicrobiae bacterium]
MSSEKIQARVIYKGRVQGVGFRASATKIACGYEVTGWVRNREDGTVELLAEGTAEEVHAFLSAIETSHLKSFIRESNVQWHPPENIFHSFRIVP